MKYTNEHKISIPMAVFLAVDKYDHDDRPNVISATSIMKSVRQTILGQRATDKDAVEDISNLLASRMGTAIHEGVEDAWTNHYKDALESLGQPKRIRDAVVINPKVPDYEDTIPVYLELRTEKMVGHWIVSGCADLIFNGQVQDLKTTGTFAYTSGSMDNKYILQLSIYRWLNQDKVIEDTGAIHFVFKDWSKLQASFGKADYPPLPIMERTLQLMSVAETNRYVEEKLRQIDLHHLTPEAELPLCSDEDLWVRESEWKYYAKVDAARATKNFKSDSAGAYAMMYNKGTGLVKEVKGKAGACNYCQSRDRCSQYSTMKQQGRV